MLAKLLPACLYCRAISVFDFAVANCCCLSGAAFVVKIGKCFGNADKHHVEYIAFGHSTSLLAPGLLKILHLKNKCLHLEEIS
jgi:hypothetical protein